MISSSSTTGVSTKVIHTVSDRATMLAQPCTIRGEKGEGLEGTFTFCGEGPKPGSRVPGRL
eukprot:2209694-Prymnesium_polylepis.1